MTSQRVSSPISDIVSATATDLSHAIHARDVSCVEVMDAYLSQIDRLNPTVNAIVAREASESLFTLARERDHQLTIGRSMGPLHGFPQAPKDIMPVAGMVTTKGSRLLKDQVSTNDAVIFERMRAGGAIFVGRTNTPEFGLGGHTYNAVYGSTRNAFDPTKSAGGSSGGAGVAVALRMLPVADGSDMMGSLRTPSSFNNVYGLRTSVGCVPHGPTDEVFFQQFSVAGPMARNIPDLAMLLRVQAGFDARLPLTRRQEPKGSFSVDLDRDLRGTRIGWMGDLGGHLATEPGLLEVCMTALRHFETAGCTVEEVMPKFELEALWRAWINLRSFSVAGGLAAAYRNEASRALLKPEAVWEVERGLGLSALDIYEAARVRSAWYQTMRILFESYDFLVLPATQVFPFPVEQDWPHAIAGRTMDSYHRWMEAVVPATMAGLPALSAPAGFNANGLPVGIQIIGPAQADAAVLQIGHAYDMASSISRKPSSLLRT